MKAQEMLKMAGFLPGQEKQFYKKYPSEKVFMAKYGAKLKKADMGMAMSQNQGSWKDYTGILGGFNLMNKVKQEKEEMENAKMWNQVSNISLQAANTIPVDTNQQMADMFTKRRQAVMPVTTGNQSYNPYGEGTNILAKNGKKIKKAQGGLEVSAISEVIDAASPLLTELWNATSPFIRNTKRYNKDTVANMSLMSGVKGVQQQYSSFMEDGGKMKLMQPIQFTQPIEQKLMPMENNIYDKTMKFRKNGPTYYDESVSLDNEINIIKQKKKSTLKDKDRLNELYKLKEDLLINQKEGKNFRTGGNIRRNEKFPSDGFAMGGDLQTKSIGNMSIQSGGYIKPLSYNPNNPSTGITGETIGKDHEHNGELFAMGGKIGAEIEGGEPVVEKLDENGESIAVVAGNLKISDLAIQLNPSLKEYKGLTVKSATKKIALDDAKLNRFEDKNLKLLDNFKLETSIDKLKLNSIKANMQGAKEKYKINKDITDDIFAYQDAINATSEELKLIPEDLAKGKFKKAKQGANIPKAKLGDKFDTLTPSQKYREQELFNSVLPITFSGYEPMGNPMEEGLINKKSFSDIKDEQEGTLNKFNWQDVFNSVLPYLRPTDAEDLDPRQLTGEMYAMSNNQLEPVQAQSFTPELSSPYSLSLQDLLNENQADYRGMERMAQNNPAALSILNAQKYAANQKVLGEQFRLNQAMRDKTYGENRNALNQAKLQNLGIFDNQYQRQAEAKSNTKATTQAALNSISAKFMQNQLENRKLQAYENLYNYRYDDKGRAINMNPLAQFNPYGNTENSQDTLSPDYEDIYRRKANGYERIGARKKTKDDASGKNGTIIKAFRNL